MKHKHGPVYDFRNCLECAAAYIRAMRPSRQRQEAGLHYLGFYHSIDRSKILEALK
ncbi:hypothetical protein UFOVP140_34 [uncultured Caudovirales phage]|uniref:Uncharacterized protein n=1 Tax=uncultured Caudovirales phage TaxID=2100421 RepID=A0A6J5LJD0_9CAUD|nr:hypothetical protein UFOVP140_34 [uncultured Caudovirales phage]